MSDDFTGHSGSYDSGHAHESVSATKWSDVNPQLPDGSSEGTGKPNTFPSESLKIAKYLGYVLALIFLIVVYVAYRS
jgi:hypothetical protein